MTDARRPGRRGAAARMPVSSPKFIRSHVTPPLYEQIRRRRPENNVEDRRFPGGDAKEQYIE